MRISTALPVALLAGSLVFSPPLTVASAAAATPHPPVSETVAAPRPAAELPAAPAPTAPRPTAPPGSLLVLHAYWTSPDSVTTSLLARRFAEVADLYSTVSGGLLDLVPTVVPGWLKIAGPTSPETCRSDATPDGILTAQTLAAAHARGYDPADFEFVVVYLPSDGCRGERTPQAWAEAPAETPAAATPAAPPPHVAVWLAGSTDTRIIAHQFAHSLGLQHTQAVACTDPTGIRVPLAERDDCILSRANSAAGAASALSAGAFDLGAAQRSSVGWMTGSAVSVTLHTLVTFSAPGAAYLTLPSGRTYWMELALPLPSAPRTAASAQVGPGVSITVVDPAFDAHPVRLDLHPDTPDASDTALQSIESYTTPEGFTIRASEVTASGAGITLTGVPSTAQVADEPAHLALQAGALSHTIAVSWMPPADDHGYGVTAYRLTRNGVDASGVRTWTTTTAPDVRGLLLTGLAAGVTYTVLVQAVTTVGLGRPVSQTVTLAAPPAAPDPPPAPNGTG